jgi:phosphodiesterase/alkaline phosphatase D-like protein
MRRSRKVGVLVALAAVLVLPVALAQGAAAPTVSTDSPKDVTSTTATFNGKVNPNGEPTNYAFDWGMTTAYGQETTITSAGTSSASKTVTAAVTGLTPGTTYHYRITASNASGTSVGSDAAFTTPAPPTVATGQASSITASSAVVNATINPQGRSTHYYFQYGPTTSYGTQTSPSGAGAGTTSVAAHATLTGLAANTTYHYRVVATNAGGTSAGSDVALKTGSSETTSHIAFMGRMGFVSPGGIIGVQAGCFGGTTPCGGHVTMSHNGAVIGQRNFFIAAQTGGFQNIGLSSFGKRLLRGNGVFHLLAVDVVVTTTAGQRTSQVMHLARWVWH